MLSYIKKSKGFTPHFLGNGVRDLAFNKKSGSRGSPPTFRKESGGFTLIEILIVISIIAIFIAMSVIVADKYQKRANDTAIGADLSQIRKVAAMVYSDENSYKNICSQVIDDNNTLNNDNSDLKAIEEAVNKITDEDPTCYSEKKGYCVQSALISSGAGYFCVDSTGFAGELETTLCAQSGYGCKGLLP